MDKLERIAEDAEASAVIHAADLAALQAIAARLDLEMASDNKSRRG